MAITKAEMQVELKQFIERFAESVERMYSGVNHANPLGHPESKAEDTNLWKTVNRMFDYGISGIAPERADLGNGETLDGEFADVEMFLRGLESLDPYLYQDDCEIPRLTIRVVRTAVARHILEGGDRFAWFDETDKVDHLSFEELALLANMDERSVRNAANPKVADPLATVAFGKRTHIEPAEAKRWLVNRKGFVPTQPIANTPPSDATVMKVNIEVETSTLQKLQSTAKLQGITVDALLAKLTQ